MMLGPYAAYIVGAYTVALVTLTALVLWIVHDGRTLRRRLADLDARGVSRRSATAREAS